MVTKLAGCLAENWSHQWISCLRSYISLCEVCVLWQMEKEIYLTDQSVSGGDILGQKPITPVLGFYTGHFSVHTLRSA